MSLLLDGYNVLHCTHVLPDRWSDIGAAGLCRLIDRAGPRGGARVVCDGAPPKLADARQSIGRVELIYAGGGKDADSLIERMIEQEKAPRELIVVSNDRRVQAAARRQGAASIGSEEFLRKLAAALRPGAASRDAKPSSEPDAAAWMEKFGFNDAPMSSQDLDPEIEHWLREFGFSHD